MYEIRIAPAAERAWSDTAQSDIDLMVIGDDVSYADLYAALSGAEAVLLRPIN